MKTKKQVPKVMPPRYLQGACRWCFGGIAIETLAEQAAGMGLAGIDLVEPSQWEVLRRHNLICTMTPSHSLTAGLCDPANHSVCLKALRNAIEATAAARFPNVICFSGNRVAKMTDADGLRNCARAVKKVMRLAEKKKVNICIELLNSKVDHKNYLCDSTEWGAELVKRVGSERFKLLYDVYHMQVQEGNIIATIRKHAPIIGHYHTAGVPGRGEPDAAQELNYPAIMRAIAQTGFDGYVVHEFIPKGDAFAALRRTVATCTI